MTIRIKTFLLIVSTVLGSWTHRCLAADPNAATLTQLEGTVKIFSHPSSSLPKETGNPAHPRVLYEGEYYQVQDAREGNLLERGNIIRTAPDSKARLVYPNGDQINLSPGTAYRVFWDEKASKRTTRIQLMYGKVRGVIEKGGPRSHLIIRTKSAVLGVRGTDFFVAEDDSDHTMHVSVIRGSVEVTPQTSNAKPMEVAAGFSAEVTAQVELRRTTQEDLIGIQKSTTVLTKPAASQGSEQIEHLEKTAVEMTLKDIRTNDPKLYEALQKKPELKLAEMTIADLNAAAVQNLLKDAPKAPQKRKPYKSELDDIEEGAYQKYFKNVE